MAGKIRVGTSSWADPEFVRDWYPRGLAARERLRYYAERFDLVELNSSFYAVPEVRLVEQWAKLTPAGFLFDVKLHKLLSRHSCELRMLPKDLQRIAETGKKRVVLTPDLEAAMAEACLGAVEPLAQAGKLGVLLLQLTPSFSPRAHRLDELDPLLSRLSPRAVAVELRNAGWLAPERMEATARWYRDREVTFVGVDAPRSGHFSVMPSIDLMTSPRRAYLRLHGRNEQGYLHGRTVAERFDYDYSDEEVREIGERVATLADEAEEVHVLFNNNRSDYAPDAARRLRELLGQISPAGELEQGTLGL